ncbi:hypothetical protein GCM10022255_087040 [Dactylosporangium darangshiense]|uniref:Uncharacterized protein n=1 Tax=Dactylosporangium darangshiense TaxID=579108 RepID=A0ABP8DN40_9ACTN
MNADEGARDDTLSTVLAGAYAATMEGHTVRAKALIAGTLAQLDPRDAPADLALIELAVLWTHLVAESKDCADPPKSVVDWAGWAVLTTRYLYGPGHRQTGRALLGLARVHAARGEHLTAATQYQALAEPCFARANPAAALLGREGAAAELHAGGQCQAGITELTAVAQDERAWLIRTPAEYRHQLAAMLAACERFAEARAVLAGADPSALAGRDLREDLGAIIATAPLADIDPMHPLVCERQAGRTDPTTRRTEHRPRRPDPDDGGSRRPSFFDDLRKLTDGWPQN